MSKSEKDIAKRYKQITDIDKAFPKDLNYLDLLILIERDPKLQALLRQVVLGDEQVQPTTAVSANAATTPSEKTASDVYASDAETDEIQTPPVASPEVSLAPEPEPEPEPEPQNPLLDELQPALNLLNQVEQDADFSDLWLHPDDTQGQTLIRLIATLSQWDQVQELWDRLASRCKTDQRPASADELSILEAALSFYNLTLRSRSAKLSQPETGIAFDHQLHTRATPQGEQINAVWLPGLTNAAGKLQKKPLVRT
ncbi:hypothetical protein [Oceanospirillum linum]|uniref:Uncharacterized protein n=1 Tax=Oceanospirillum linum TaxID=966 RepID=A0A1T1HF32_OCELI|nr:hypothetical protein [Oceanospirillum linum]OOV88330.1 hypothetical protein BTA35_0202090 [Oceanospirillum linum]SEF52501.1 hypothetical protein SAMN04489856_101429 [Oleiphilus messinensis]SMP04465.1 hypothetical protein SAMN06264348_101430 [Oceanospirillum linum]